MNDPDNIAGYVRMVCSSFQSTNNGPLFCIHCGKESTEPPQTCTPPIKDWSGSDFPITEPPSYNALPELSTRKHEYEVRYASDDNFIQCRACGHVCIDGMPFQKRGCIV